MIYKRRNYFIDKPFQAKFILKFCAIVVASSVIIGFMLFFLLRNFTTVAIENGRVIVKDTSNFILPIVIQTLIVTAVFSAVAVIAVTLFASHKIAGPLYRLKKEIDAFTKGDLNANFHTRKDDQLQDLMKSLLEMGAAFKERHGALKAKVSQLKEQIRSSGPDKAALENTVRELEEIINYFKV